MGPRRNDFGHIGPDKADLDFEYHFGEDGEKDKREEFRNYKRPPLFLPETTQQEFYSETLTKLRNAKYQLKTLWTNVRNMRFWDGRTLGFIEEPIKKVNAAVRQVTANVYNTIHKLKYDTDRLDVRIAAKKRYTLEKSMEPKRDMPGIITQLTQQQDTKWSKRENTREKARSGLHLKIGRECASGWDS